MQLEDLETDIAVSGVKAEVEAPRSVVGAFARRSPGRKPFALCISRASAS